LRRERDECSSAWGQFFRLTAEGRLRPLFAAFRDGRKRPSTEWQNKFAPKANNIQAR